MSATVKCRAKNPATCPYHGTPVASATTVQQKISQLFAGQPQYYEAFAGKANVLSCTVNISPMNTNAAKTSSVEMKVSGKTYEDLVTNLQNKLSSVNLKPYKNGYKANIYYPASENKNAPKLPRYHIYESDAPQLMSNDLVQDVEYHQKSQEAFNRVINGLKDSKIAQSPNGAKTIAVIEAMNDFGYFPSTDYKYTNVSATFQAISNQTSEYTNRRFGIRTYFSYDRKGNIRNAYFSLDNPNSSSSIFTNEQVDEMNQKLSAYFNKIDGE